MRGNNVKDDLGGKAAVTLALRNLPLATWQGARWLVLAFSR